MDMFFVMAAKPFMFLALALTAYLISRLLWRAIPDGRVKRFLYDKGFQQRNPWLFAILGFVGVYGAILLVMFTLL